MGDSGTEASRLAPVRACKAGRDDSVSKHVVFKIYLDTLFFEWRILMRQVDWVDAPVLTLTFELVTSRMGIRN